MRQLRHEHRHVLALHLATREQLGQPHEEAQQVLGAIVVARGKVLVRLLDLAVLATLVLVEQDGRQRLVEVRAHALAHFAVDALVRRAPRLGHLKVLEQR